MERRLDALLRAVGRIRAEQIQPSRRSPALSELTGELAPLLSWNDGPDGFSAQAGLWFNPPVPVEYFEGRVEVLHVTERIVELPFVFAQVAAAGPAPLRILDVGGGESTLALSLASLGHDVVLVDPRGSRLAHPRLTVEAKRLEELDARAARFDARRVAVGDRALRPRPLRRLRRGRPARRPQRTGADARSAHAGRPARAHRPDRADGLDRRLPAHLRPGGRARPARPAGSPSRSAPRGSATASRGRQATSTRHRATAAWRCWRRDCRLGASALWQPAFSPPVLARGGAFTPGGDGGGVPPRSAFPRERATWSARGRSSVLLRHLASTEIPRVDQTHK